MKNKIKIDLGYDGDPNKTPPSVCIIIDDEYFRIEVECYKEAWCILDNVNTEKLFDVLEIKNNSEIEPKLKDNFLQSSTLQNFKVLDKFMSICEKHNIKYTYNSWCSQDR